MLLPQSKHRPLSHETEAQVNVLGNIKLRSYTTVDKGLSGVVKELEAEGKQGWNRFPAYLLSLQFYHAKF